MPVPKIIHVITLIVFAVSAARSADEVALTKCWSYPTGEAVGRQLSSSDAQVFIGTEGGRIEAISRDGKKLWAAEFGGEIASNLLAREQGVFVVTISAAENAPRSPTLRRLSVETGLATWSARLPEAGNHFLIPHSDALIVVSNETGTVQSLDARSGTPRWKREIAAGFVAEPVALNDKVYIASTGNQLFTLSAATGEIQLMQKLRTAVAAIGVGKDGEIFVGDDRGNLSSLSPAGKANWTYKTGGKISSIVAVNGHVLATSHDNFAYFIVAKNGGLAWKKRLAGRSTHVAAIGEQFALTTSIDEQGATLADLTSGRVAGQISLASKESLVTTAVVSDNSIFALTNQSVYRYSLNGCGGPATTAFKKK
jgi:outer membrane protein assembly factor BamB